MVSTGPNVPPSPLVDRAKCNDKDKHVVTADTDGDKKPDSWKFFKTIDVGGQKTEVITCKQVDLNHDGKIDMVNYYDDGGPQIVLEEIDGDFDGKFDFTAYYNQNKRVRDEFDMNFDQRVDLWKYYEEGKLVRIEKDPNNDGKVDEWEYYEGGKLDRIGYDTSGSGRVDQWDRAPEVEEEAPGGTPAPARRRGTPAGGAHRATRGAAPPASARRPRAKPAPAAKPAKARRQEVVRSVPAPRRRRRCPLRREDGCARTPPERERQLAAAYPLLHRDVGGQRRARVDLARTADLRRRVLDHLLPVGDPAGQAAEANMTVNMFVGMPSAR